MSARPPLLGAVLAGGGGVRFGGPKGPALLDDGRSFARRAVEALRPVVADVVVVSSRPVGDPGAPVIPDAVDGAGPLGGVLAALREADARGLDGVLVLACDLLRVGPDVLAAVAARRTLGPIVAPARTGGGVEPLCAAYAASVRPAVEAALADGRHALHDLFDAAGGVAVDPAALGASGPDTFLNVNTPADLETARSGSRGASSRPPIVCVVGRKKSGKTTTVVGLVAELVARGRRVMTVKHGHGFRLDTEGTDSWRHVHEGGAARVVMAGPDRVAVAGAWGPDGEPSLETLVDRYLADADLVVAEGFKNSGAPRVEVFRRAVHDVPLYGRDPATDGLYLAVLTDAPDLRAGVPVVDVDDPGRFQRLADLIERRLEEGGPWPPSNPPS